MRILFVVPYTPNQIRVRSYSLIRSLSDKGHQVTVLTLSSGPADQADGAALAEHCHEVISLPIHTEMEHDQLNYIITSVVEFFQV